MRARWLLTDRRVESRQPGGHGNDLFIGDGRLRDRNEGAKRPSRITRGMASLNRLRAGAREIVMDESLGDEAGQEAPDHRMLQMQMHYFIRHRSGVVEDYRADGRAPAPFPEARSPRSRGPTRRIERRGPCGVGFVALID